MTQIEQTEIAEQIHSVKELNAEEFAEYKAPKELYSNSGMLLTEEQRIAIEKLVNWALTSMAMSRKIPVRERAIRLEGVPGAGKSTILMVFVRELKRIRESVIAATAPTHKAKRVLIDLAVENQMWDLKISTLQSQLGLKASLDDMGEDFFLFDDRKRKIHENDIVVADESSMINPEQWEYLNSLENCPPMILSCDRDQLKPVESNEKSPIFFEVKKGVFLCKPMRYSGAIGEYVGALRKSSTFVDPTLFKDDDKLMIVNKAEWFKMLIEEFSKTNSPSVRALAYTNKGVRYVNNVIHYASGIKRLGEDFKNQEEYSALKNQVPQYEEGIEIIFKKAINEWDKLEGKRVVRVHNGTEAKIRQAYKTTHEGFSAWYIDAHWYDVTVFGDIIPMSYQGYCLDESELKRFNEIIDDLKVQIFPYKNEQYHPIKTALKREIARHRDMFLNWDKGELYALTYTYASTIHTGQGSGWKTVFAFLPDIVKCSDGSTLKELIYTCVSRAKEKLVIMV